MNFIKDNSLIICTNNIKKDILLYLTKNKIMKNIKFMTLEEFVKSLTFSYDKKVISFLMEKYNLKYNVVKQILKNLYFVEEKKYNNKKLDELVKIKKDIKEYIIKDDNFKNFIKDKSIIILGYDFIDKYYLNLFEGLNYHIINKTGKNKHEVLEFNTIFEEVSYVSNKIVELIDNKVPINKIKIVDLPNEYSFIIKTIFKMFNLNININNENIYSTNIVQDYLNLYDEDKNVQELLNKYDFKKEENLYVYNKIIDVLNDNLFITNKEIKKEILINEFKKIKTYSDNYSEQIEVKRINEVNDDDYVFILGFNEGNFPVLVKDEDYLSDKEKNILGLNKSFEIINYKKENIINNIKSIKNLFISYKLKTPFDQYYPSNLIEDLKYDIIKAKNNNYNYSNDFNKLILSKELDNFVKFGEKSEELELLYSNYKNNEYMTYNNNFKGIDKNQFYNYINNELTLSYSSIDNYYKCKFKYYLNNILKLDKYEETFAILVGNLFHYILSKCFEEKFDFEKEYNDYLSNYELNNKDRFFVNKLKEDLLFIIETIKKQYSYSNFKEAKYENKFSINKDSNIKVNFIGYIDKLLYHEYKDKTLLVIIDYKTGIQDINLTNSYYGLNMQLPIYLYLVKNNNIKNSEVIGFYLQKILTGIPKIDKKSIVEQKEDALKLQGYTIDEEDLIKEFDSTYDKSKVIKSLGKTQNGFNAYSKILSKRQIESLYNLVDKKIDEAKDKILNTDFEIDPKRVGFNNVSCKYCKYKDICFMNQNNVKILEEIKDLSFLGGDDNANMD